MLYVMGYMLYSEMQWVGGCRSVGEGKIESRYVGCLDSVCEVLNGAGVGYLDNGG